MNSGSTYITLGYNFLQLTINAIDEMEKQGNHYIILSAGTSSEKETWDNYHEKTRWNDNNIALPVLFNFYHGIELILKGLTIQCGSYFERTHILSELLNNLSKSKKPPQNDLIVLLEEILDFDPNGFYSKNKTSSDKAYLLFRYPEVYNDEDKKKYQVLSNLIKAKGEIGLVTFKEIRDYSHKVRSGIITWKENSKLS
jgi:HEPN domain-containing protein